MTSKFVKRTVKVKCPNCGYRVEAHLVMRFFQTGRITVTTTIGHVDAKEKPKRGRPPKENTVATGRSENNEQPDPPRKRGRPRKNPIIVPETQSETPKQSTIF